MHSPIFAIDYFYYGSTMPLIFN